MTDMTENHPITTTRESDEVDDDGEQYKGEKGESVKEWNNQVDRQPGPSNQDPPAYNLPYLPTTPPKQRSILRSSSTTTPYPSTINSYSSQSHNRSISIHSTLGTMDDHDPTNRSGTRRRGESITERDLREIGRSPGDFLGLDLGVDDEDERTSRERQVESGDSVQVNQIPSVRVDERGLGSQRTERNVGRSPSLTLGGSRRSSALSSTGYGTIHPPPGPSTSKTHLGFHTPNLPSSPSHRSSTFTRSPSSKSNTRKRTGTIKRLDLHSRSSSRLSVGFPSTSISGSGYEGYGYAGNEEDDHDEHQYHHRQGGPRTTTAVGFSGFGASPRKDGRGKTLSRTGSMISGIYSIGPAGVGSRTGTMTGRMRSGGGAVASEGLKTGRGGSFVQVLKDASGVMRGVVKGGGSRAGSQYDSDVLGDEEEEDEGHGFGEEEREGRSISDGRYGFGGPVDEGSMGFGTGGVEVGAVPDHMGMEMNGTRVWYSSYDSIDWLHDQIKDSVRHSKIKARAGRSWRGKVGWLWDRSMGWIVVSLVGFVTALVAYLVIKIEAYSFDLKSGFCSVQPWGFKSEKNCAPGGWVEWEDVEWGWMIWLRGLYGGDNAGEIVVYFLIAMALAVFSSVLTIYLTASTRFETTPEGTFAPRPKSKPDKKSSVTGNGHSEQTALLSSTAIWNPQNGQTNGTPETPRKVLYFASGSGIPEVKTILSGFVIRGYLGFSTLFVKSFGLALSVASGMSLGKEGPFVHIACCCGNIISRSFAKYELNEGKKREILSAACGAGVAVAFGAPIGGTLFSWEESSTYYPAKVMWRTFFCAAVAALTLRAMDPYGNGKLVLLEVTYARDYHTNSIYVVALIVGILGGIYGGYWSRANIAWTKNVRAKTWMKSHPIWEVAMVSAITTFVSFPSLWTRMGGVEWVSSLFAECDDTGDLCYVAGNYRRIMSELGWGFIVRAALACITFGIKLPAGIFVPSLAAGAAFGRMLGVTLQFLAERYPNWTFLPDEAKIAPGAYALIGAAATLAGVTRTTVSLAVIVVELTGTLDYVVPVAIAILAAKVCSDAILAEGIYDLVINLNQFPYLDCKKDYHFGARSIYDVVDTSLPYIQVDMKHTVSSLRASLEAIVPAGHRDGCFPCLRRQDDTLGLGVVGVLAVNELQHALNELSDDPAAPCNLMPNLERSPDEAMSVTDSIEEDPYDLSIFIDQAPTVVLSNSPLELLSQMFNKLGTKAIVVLDEHGRYVGCVLKKGWLKFLTEIESDH